MTPRTLLLTLTVIALIAALALPTPLPPDLMRWEPCPGCF